MLRAMAGAYALVNMAVEIIEMSPMLLIPSAAGRIPPMSRPIEPKPAPRPVARLVRTGPSPAEKLLERQRARRQRTAVLKGMPR